MASEATLTSTDETSIISLGDVIVRAVASPAAASAPNVGVKALTSQATLTAVGSVDITASNKVRVHGETGLRSNAAIKMKNCFCWRSDCCSSQRLASVVSETGVAIDAMLAVSGATSGAIGLNAHRVQASTRSDLLFTARGQTGTMVEKLASWRTSFCTHCQTRRYT